MNEMFNILSKIVSLPFNIEFNTSNGRMYLTLPSFNHIRKLDIQGTTLGQFVIEEHNLVYFNYDNSSRNKSCNKYKNILMDLRDPSIDWTLCLAEYLKEAYEIEIPWTVAQNYLED